MSDTDFHGAKYQRRPRSDKGTIRATARDLRALGWIVAQYGIRMDQLAQLLGTSSGMARYTRDRWRQAGWVESRVILAGEPAWVWLTREGQRQIGTEYRHWEPRLAALNHTRQINTVRLYLEGQRPNGTWTSERTLIQQREASAREARSRGEAAPKGYHLPDGLWEREPGADVTAIEIELSYKGPETTRQNMYKLLRQYPRAAYFTIERIRNHLEALLNATPELNQRIQVIILKGLNDGNK